MELLNRIRIIHFDASRPTVILRGTLLGYWWGSILAITSSSSIGKYWFGRSILPQRLPRKQKGNERLRNGRKFITETAMFHQYLLITRIFRFVARSVMRTNNSFTLNLSSSFLESYERQKEEEHLQQQSSHRSDDGALFFFRLCEYPSICTLLGRLLNIFCSSCPTDGELVFREWMELISLHVDWIVVLRCRHRLWGR